MAFGADVGLGLLDEIAGLPALRDYAPLPAARGDVLFRAGRLDEARSEFLAAAGLSRNAQEAKFLRARADACKEAAPQTGRGVEPCVQDNAERVAATSKP